MDSDATYITDTYHIVGDKAFPLKKHILTPYKKYQKRRRTRAQKIYNKHLASKRQVCRHYGVMIVPDTNTDTYTRGLLDSVNFCCFVPNRFKCFHCHAMRKAIKAYINLNELQQIYHTPDIPGSTLPYSCNVWCILWTQPPRLKTDKFKSIIFRPLLLRPYIFQCYQKWIGRHSSFFSDYWMNLHAMQQIEHTPIQNIS